MPRLSFKDLQLSDADLNFLVETVAPGVSDKPRLKEIICKDTDFRGTFVSDEKVFRRVMDDQEIFLKISPRLFFEILLRKTAGELEGIGYTVEKSSHLKVPVFDSSEVAELLANEALLVYLADMLSSFMKIRSYAVSFRIRKGVYRKIRISDMDIESLRSLCEAVDEKSRLNLYKRIADICLFILGIFPDYAEREVRYPSSGQLRPRIAGRLRFSPDEYEREGRKFYKLAAEHRTAKELKLSDTFWTLHSHFRKARKPLNFIAEHYLEYKRYGFFG